VDEKVKIYGTFLRLDGKMAICKNIKALCDSLHFEFDIVGTVIHLAILHM
jgi:hypothetical protein